MLKVCIYALEGIDLVGKTTALKKVIAQYNGSKSIIGLRPLGNNINTVVHLNISAEEKSKILLAQHLHLLSAIEKAQDVKLMLANIQDFVIEYKLSEPLTDEVILVFDRSLVSNHSYRLWEVGELNQNSMTRDFFRLPYTCIFHKEISHATYLERISQKAADEIVRIEIELKDPIRYQALSKIFSQVLPMFNMMHTIYTDRSINIVYVKEEECLFEIILKMLRNE